MIVECDGKPHLVTLVFAALNKGLPAPKADTEAFALLQDLLAPRCNGSTRTNDIALRRFGLVRLVDALIVRLALLLCIHDEVCTGCNTRAGHRKIFQLGVAASFSTSIQQKLDAECPNLKLRTKKSTDVVE